MDAIKDIEKKNMKKRIPEFKVGDTVAVHTVITEGEKERIQVFTGTVIRRKGTGVSETFTVRRLVAGEGVERTWPLHSPKITKLVVEKAGKVRRSKLYYLRDRVGKATRVKESVEETVRIKRKAKADSIAEMEAQKAAEAEEKAREEKAAEES